MTADALNLSLAGLDVTKARIDTLSRNISNAQTPGYSEKTQTQTTGALGQVMLGPVTRNVNQQLQNSLNQTTGTVNQLQVSVNLLSKIETAFGSPGSDSSLSSAITGLQNAFQDLSVNPEQGTLYNSVLDAAKTVALNLNQLSQTISTANSDAGQQIQQSVTTVNQALQSIDALNKQIVAAGVGADVTDLQDQRDQAISTVSGAMDITTYTKSDGTIAVYTADGKPLVDFSAATISQSGNNIEWNMPPAAPATIRISSGTLGGLQTLQKSTLPGVQSQLDDIARALTVEFNNINIPLFNDGGSSPLLGSNPALPISPANPVNPTQLTGYAGRIAVNQAVIATPTLIRDGNSPVPLAPGDTMNIDQAVALFNRQNVTFNSATGLPATGSLVQAATSFVSGQSTLRANAQNSLTSEQALQQTLQNQVSAQSGVNIDSEVAQLAVLQNAYSANARVLTTSQNLFTTLFNAVQ